MERVINEGRIRVFEASDDRTSSLSCFKNDPNSQGEVLKDVVANLENFKTKTPGKSKNFVFKFFLKFK